MNRIYRTSLVLSISIIGLAACGSDTKSPAPAGTQVMTPTSEAMMTPTTEAMMTPTTEAMMAASTTTGG